MARQTKGRSNKILKPKRPRRNKLQKGGFVISSFMRRVGPALVKGVAQVITEVHKQQANKL